MNDVPFLLHSWIPYRFLLSAAAFGRSSSSFLRLLVSANQPPPTVPVICLLHLPSSSLLSPVCQRESWTIYYIYLFILIFSHIVIFTVIFLLPTCPPTLHFRQRSIRATAAPKLQLRCVAVAFRAVRPSICAAISTFRRRIDRRDDNQELHIGLAEVGYDARIRICSR